MVEKEDATRIMSKASVTDTLVTLLCLLIASLAVCDEGERWVDILVLGEMSCAEDGHKCDANRAGGDC